VFTALAHLHNTRGVLLIIKNYTGDVINFIQALEKAKRHFSSDTFKYLIVADDVTFIDTPHIKPRGLAGTILLYKILGYLA
jgi:dihydroxyacetone kinase